VFWDIYGKLGHPVRADGLGDGAKTCFGRLLELNDVQSGGVLEIVFKLADDHGWLLLDLKDLRALLTFASDKAHAKGHLGSIWIDQSDLGRGDPALAADLGKRRRRCVFRRTRTRPRPTLCART